ncbi:MAG: glycosyltransferase [Janthinobacterium lividum]
MLASSGLAVALTVLSVAYALAPVGPDAVGGAEQILSALDRALVRAGHRSVVVAQAGSAVAGELVPVAAAAGTLGVAERAAAEAAVRAAAAGVLARGGVDLVHMHGIDFAATMPAAGGVPVLVTLHLPPAWYPAGALRPRPGVWLVCVSDAQYARCPPSDALLPPIANGVDVAALGAARHACRGYAVCLGRVCPEKGQHLAAEAARLAGATLLLAGEVFGYPEHQVYFADQVVPLLDARRRFVGPVGFARKRRMLGSARCLLVPSLAEETSSLVAMEALACGTPVIAFPVGALPGIVRDGVTGFLVDDAAGMAEAIGRAGGLDRAACRAEAVARFSAERMSSEYLALYGRLAA